MPIYKGITPSHDYSKFVVNYNLQNFSGPYDKLVLLTARREDYPGVCYHIRINDIIREGLCHTANYEIVFQNSQWDVLTGVYAPGYQKVKGARIAPRPAVEGLECVKSFPPHDFFAARKFCVRHADVGAGAIEWADDDAGARRGRTFLRLLEYKIKPRGTEEVPGKFLAQAQGTYNTSEDKLKLDAYLGGYSTAVAAEAVCQEHYNDFVEKYFTNGFSDNQDEPEEESPPVAATKVSLDYNPATHFWIEPTHMKNNYFLSHPERRGQEFLICPAAVGYRAYLINNLETNCFLCVQKPVEYPEVIFLAENSEVAPLKRLCERVFAARGDVSKMTGNALVRGVRAIFMPARAPGDSVPVLTCQ